MAGGWHIDHFLPQSANAGAILDYNNLLYLCKACNENKGARLIPDPCKVSLKDCIQVNSDGSISALNALGKRLIDTLRLDNADYRNYRRLMIKTLRSLAIHQMDVFVLWMQYPDDLPDLSRLRPQGNNRPVGIIDCHYARRSRNVFPEVY